MYSNLLNCIDLMKQEFGKYNCEIVPNTWCKVNILDQLFYVFHNKGTRILKINFGNEYKIIKTSYIFSKQLPLSVQELKLAPDTVIENERLYDCDDLNDHRVGTFIHYTDVKNIKSELPRLLKDELTSEEFLVDVSKYGYFFAVPLRDDLVEVLDIQQNSNGISFSYNGDHVRTILKAKYDPETKLIYCDSWKYIEKCIAMIDKKVVTLPMKQLMDMRNKLRESLKNLNREIDSCGDDINFERLSKEINMVSENIRTMRLSENVK